MAFELIWSPTAKFDLNDLSTFIAEDSTLAAEKFINNLLQTVEKLSFFPESGRIVPEFEDPTIREIIRKPCRIIYRLDNQQKIIEIVRFWHSARGMPNI